MTPKTSIAPGRTQVSTGRCDSHPGHNPSLPGKPVLPSGGFVAFSPRVRLVTLSTVRAIRGVDGEKVSTMVDNMIHPQHIKFAFNISHKTGNATRALRFWTAELSAPALVQKFSIEEAIREILGTRETFPRGELEIAWTCSVTQIGKLITAKLLTLKGALVTRASLETFLWIRWAANNPT